MKHFTSPSFWTSYGQLPRNVQELADKNFELAPTADLTHETCHSEGGTTEESLHESLINLAKRIWLRNERFFASLRMTIMYLVM